MDKTIADFMSRLKQQTTEELIRGLDKLLSLEKALHVKVIAHLSEISQRKAHLDMGYKSLFSYCEEKLKLEPGVIWQRLQIAGKCSEFPELLMCLLEGKITVSVAAKLCSHLSKDNVEQLLRDCSHKSSRTVDEYLAGLRPLPVFKPMVRKISKTTLEPATPGIYNFRFSGSTALKEKIERLSEVMDLNPTTAMEQIMEFAVECALEKKDPQRKEKRREQRKEKIKTKSEPKKSSPNLARYIPASLRAKALKASSYQCEFCSSEGVRCLAKKNLQVDHIFPFAMGGRHEPKNLRILCRAHNLRKAEKDFGGFLFADLTQANSTG